MNYKRNRFFYFFAKNLLGGYFRRKFNLKSRQIDIQGPCIIIANHSCDFDPIFVGLSISEHSYFVASEHLARLGFISKLLYFTLGFITKRKGESGLDTVKQCLKELKKGHSVCLFAEGEASWNGVSGKVFPATGKLIKMSRVPLYTLKINGAYLSKPRWGKDKRRGEVKVELSSMYTPDDYKNLDYEEINDIINRDIYVDVADNKVEFTGKNIGENLETALCVCPKCKSISTLKSSGNKVFCECGFSTTFLSTGKLGDNNYFSDIISWDIFEDEELFKMHQGGGLNMRDSFVELSEIKNDHSQEMIYKGNIEYKEDALIFGDNHYDICDIKSMVMVRNNRLLFTHKKGYFEVFSKEAINLRKYMKIYDFYDN